MSKPLQKLVACSCVDADLPIASVEKVLAPKALVVRQNIQHHIFDPRKAVPGDFSEEEAGEGVVGLVTWKVRKAELKTVVSVGEATRDLMLDTRDLFQKSPVHVTDIIQPNDRVVQDGRSSDKGDLWFTFLVLNKLLQKVSIAVEGRKGVI